MEIPPEEYLRREISGMDINSVIDVGTGHGGVFDYWEWERKNPALKVCLDVKYIRPDISKTWHKIKASATNLPFKDESFDLVVSTEIIEHVPVEKHEMAVSEMVRVARKGVYITSTDESAHQGLEYLKFVEFNPFNKYIEIVDENLLRKKGFKILLKDEHRIKAFLHKKEKGEC